LDDEDDDMFDEEAGGEDGADGGALQRTASGREKVRNDTKQVPF
jgi:hypothetical protein